MDSVYTISFNLKHVLNMTNHTFTFIVNQYIINENIKIIIIKKTHLISNVISKSLQNLAIC